MFLCLGVFFWWGDIFKELLEFTTKAASGFSNLVPLSFFFLKKIFIYLFISAVLGLSCSWAFL